MDRHGGCNAEQERYGETAIAGQPRAKPAARRAASRQRTGTM